MSPPKTQFFSQGPDSSTAIATSQNHLKHLYQDLIYRLVSGTFGQFQSGNHVVNRYRGVVDKMSFEAVNSMVK